MNKGCLIAGGILLLVLSLALGYYFYQQTSEPTVQYKTIQPEIKDVVSKTVATGSIKPRKEVNIKPQVSGIVEKLFVEAGELVNKGQKIARIKLIPSPVNINNAESSVSLARIRFEESKRALSRQQDVNSKNLDIQSSKSSFQTAQVEEERQRKLFQDGVISEQEYNRFKLDLDLRKTEYENAMITAGDNLKQLEADLDIRKQELDAAINNLQLLKEGASRNSKQVSNVITSTVNGMVLDVPVEEGSSVIERNNFNEGTSIAIVADMQSLIFEGKVDEADVGRIKEGMALQLTVGALPDHSFKARLEHISPKGEEEEGTIKFLIKAAIENQNEVFLRAGYSASGDIILAKQEEVLTVKERDVLERNDSSFVEVEVGDNDFEERFVETGIADGIDIEVKTVLDTTMRIKVQQGSEEEY